ncbi:MAG: hypothetical protein ACKVKR_08210, partial [Pseudomonadales bacterium]
MFKKLFTTAAALGAFMTPLHAGDLSTMSWDEIVAQAKEEGNLTWYVWYLQDDFRRAISSFEDEYGISVKIPDGDNAGNSQKMLAEKDRETGDIDVFAWGYDSFETVELKSLFNSLDKLPKDDGRVSKLAGVDGGDHVLAFWGNQSGIAYDPAKVSEADLPQSIDDFATFWTDHPNKFGFNY